MSFTRYFRRVCRPRLNDRGDLYDDFRESELQVSDDGESWRAATGTIPASGYWFDHFVIHEGEAP